MIELKNYQTEIDELPDYNRVLTYYYKKLRKLSNDVASNLVNILWFVDENPNTQITNDIVLEITNEDFLNLHWKGIKQDIMSKKTVDYKKMEKLLKEFNLSYFAVIIDPTLHQVYHMTYEGFKTFRNTLSSNFDYKEFKTKNGADTWAEKTKGNR